MEKIRIDKIIEGVITILTETHPSLVKIIMKEKPLITTIKVSNGIEEEIYSIIDFTSKQEDHYHDLENYTLQLYEGFNKTYFKC